MDIESAEYFATCILSIAFIIVICLWLFWEPERESVEDAQEKVDELAKKLKFELGVLKQLEIERDMIKIEIARLKLETLLQIMQEDVNGDLTTDPHALFALAALIQEIKEITNKHIEE